MATLRTHLLLTITTSALLGCGDNAFKQFAKEEALTQEEEQKDQAIDAIVSKDWNSAAVILEQIVTENPENYEAKSMLGNVQMKQTGLDAIEFADKIEKSESEDGTIQVGALLEELPEGSAENVELLQKAKDTFESIPDENLNATQKTQKAVAEFSYSMVLAKSTVLDEDGNYDPEKASDLTVEEAEEIVEHMDAAADTLLGIGGDQNISAAQRLDATVEQINNFEGEDLSEKLKAFLEAETQKQEAASSSQ